MSRSIPTDRQILEAILRRYYDEYVSYAKEDGTRSTKIFVPIDIDEIAHDLGTEGDIVFGRLYYHLERRYGYQQDGGARVHFFALRIDKDTHCVNFPLMASVLANLQEQSRKHNQAIWIAAGSLVVAWVSLLVSILRR